MVFSLDIKRVLISDNLDSGCKDILEENGITVDVKTKLSKDELLSEIQNYDALIVRSATKVTAEVINAGKNLKIIGRAGTGVDNIDIPTASHQGVIVMNTPGGNTISAVEHTCAMICSLARSIPQAAASMKEGKWDRKKYMGTELFGKTLAIVGLGRIGREVATRIQSYGVKTIGFDPLVPAEEAIKFNVEAMDLEKLWPLADIITVHTPLIPQTRGLLNDKVFSCCKKGVYVINVARGGIIDEAALLRALESGQCGGAALDVFECEPPTDVSASVVQHPKVVACPHLGASTVEAQVKVAKEIAEQIVDAVQGKSLVGAINAMALSDALKPQSKPWVKLGQALGKLASVIAGGNITKATIIAYGQEMKAASGYLMAAVTTGLLNRQDANLVNSAVLAKEHGLQVSISVQAEAPSGFAQAVSVSVPKESGSTTLTGTVFGTNTPMLVEYNGVRLLNSLALSGNLLLTVGGFNPMVVLSKFLSQLESGGTKNCSFSCGTGSEESLVVLKTEAPLEESICKIDGAKLCCQVLI